MYGAVATLWGNEFQLQTVRGKKLVAKYRFLGILSRGSRAWGPWLSYGMGRARGGFGRTYGQVFFSFCRLSRGGRICDGTQVMASQGFWSSQWDQWCLSLCGTYCMLIWLSDAAPSPPCGWGVLLVDPTLCCNTLHGVSRELCIWLFWGTGMTL